MTKIPYVELLGTAYNYHEREIAELEAKRNGDPERDELIDGMQELPKSKLATLEIMFEIETGKKMHAD